MTTLLAQSSAYPVVVGAGSIGPFPVPVGSPGVVFTLQRACLPADVQLGVDCLASFDGGATYDPLVATQILGNSFYTGPQTQAQQTRIQIEWTKLPTHIRLEVNSSSAFSADFSIASL